MDSISAIPQQPELGKLAQFLRYLETQNAPEFLPKQLDVMGLLRQLALPQASTVENLSYGNLPFTMPPSGTGAMIPQVKTGRKPEVADLVGMIGGVPGVGAVSDVGTKLSNQAADVIVRAITKNPMATAPQVIQETAMPFMNAVAPKAPGLLAPRSELGFYSALEEAVTPLQNKGTGTQFLAQLEKTPGVKPEEIKWTGLDDFLKSRQNVTKPEIENYLAQNRVNLQEVRLGEMSPEQLALRNNALNRYKEITDLAADTRQKVEEGILSSQEARAIFEPLYAERFRLDKTINTANQSINTKFSSYTLPGGDNYREILLTLPIQPKGTNRYEVRPRKAPGESSVFDTEANKVIMFGRDAGMYQEAERLNRELAGTQLFKSSHFDQPNILAHMRVNDRVVDGKKTLFIEEIQSDWHQAGRKHGYANNKSQSETDELYRTLGGTQKTPVPDAPFKTSWHELSLKRAIQEASEKGYDKIAFTTGKTQAERYDLSKQVNTLRAPFDNGEYVVSYIPTGENEYRFLGRFTEQNLPNAVGKDLAEKIVANKGVQTMTYKGNDLSIGGEGMKGFYDNILPKSLEKLGKKFDAKVNKTTMDGTEVWQMDITPKMRESVLTKGQPLFAVPFLPAGLLDRENQ